MTDGFVRRSIVYVEKKPAFANEACALLCELKEFLQISSLTAVRVINRYDIENVSQDLLRQCIDTVFSEPQTDICFDTLNYTDDFSLGVQLLPGQFDQRADSAAQCIQIISCGERPCVQNTRIYIFSGNLTDDDKAAIKKHLINTVEAREVEISPKNSLALNIDIPLDVPVIDGFISMDKKALQKLRAELCLSMDYSDLLCLFEYFKNENRNPTITEVKVIDTYWSDHCRHTTFLTEIRDVSIDYPTARLTYEEFLEYKKLLYKDTQKPLTLMELATIGAKYLKHEGYLQNLDISDEINACCIKIIADIDGERQPWLLMFKNETHNHPTEIEPFGGAATCIGGAIRDPLSGRSYVYQAMRITGAANPLLPASETLAGKLPQRKLTTTAAAGYSSYGNQIGLATGYIREFYHSGYAAKRMEVGAVIGAVPADGLKREMPIPGDIVVLLGGRTGRDGCGGATGSSKSHNLSSCETCGAEVQKGNAPEERKLQRLFRNKTASLMIKRCNDFGAGGVCVAIGELADGLDINLDSIPKKYEGLSGTELAISESQERMAVVLSSEDLPEFIALANSENLEATAVATVTDKHRMIMTHRGKVIADLHRDFLNSNGARRFADIHIENMSVSSGHFSGNSLSDFETIVTDLNICSQQGLCERFDSTIGAGAVLMPFGGRYQKTPAQVMVAKLPVINGETSTCSVMSCGFDPFLCENPFAGGYYAVYESIARLVSSGASHEDAYLSFQEYFERLGNNPKRWGKPFAALLGALKAQLELKTAAIGGKDSMSGSFEDLDVPPTLISFAVKTADAEDIISPEFKSVGNVICLFAPKITADGLLDAKSAQQCFETVHRLITDKTAVSAYAVGIGGICESIFKMCLGNRIGFKFSEDFNPENLYRYRYGGILLELCRDVSHGEPIGITTEDYTLCLNGETIDIDSLENRYYGILEPVFPMKTVQPADNLKDFLWEKPLVKSPSLGIAQPRVIIPVFPGTNCEYDTQRAFTLAGAKAEVLVLRNLSTDDINSSVKALATAINNSQIIAIPGGFSGGDEPDGSGKFITAFFKNPFVFEAVEKLLKQHDGLICGICNGFQALIKLGLVPYGKIKKPLEYSPTLTTNLIGRHQSRIVKTKVCSNLSPWLSSCNVGDVYSVAISHGEGRFVADEQSIQTLSQNGQIALRYVDDSGTPSLDYRYNPNGSAYAVEGITSPDGRILGRMGHPERFGSNLYKNIPGTFLQTMFQNGVRYFK